MSARLTSLTAALLAAALAAACSTVANPENDPSPAPAQPLTDSPEELQAQFEELSGLVLPSDATDLEIEGRVSSDDRPAYTLRFESTRGGAEVICTGDNLGVYPVRRPPDEQQRELFDIREDDDTVAETVECRGSKPENPRVQRTVVVVFPEDGMRNEDGSPDGTDLAVVYAHGILWPRD